MTDRPTDKATDRPTDQGSNRTTERETVLQVRNLIILKIQKKILEEYEYARVLYNVIFLFKIKKKTIYILLKNWHLFNKK